MSRVKGKAPRTTHLVPGIVVPAPETLIVHDRRDALRAQARPRVQGALLLARLKDEAARRARLEQLDRAVAATVPGASELYEVELTGPAEFRDLTMTATNPAPGTLVELAEPVHAEDCDMDDDCSCHVSEAT